MKTFILCVLLAVASAQTASFTFDPPSFIDATLQGTLGWAYPVNFQYCKANLVSMAESYVAFWETFENFSTDTLYSSGQSLVSSWMVSPRCYYATNIAAVFSSMIVFTTVSEVLEVLGLGVLGWFAEKGYEVIAYYGSLVFDAWTLYYDAMEVYNGSFDSTTLGYIAAFFIRGMFHSTF